MFCCGALLWVHRDRVPVSRLLAGLCMAMIGVGALTPNYRLVAAPAVAYLCVYVAVVLGRHRRLVLQNDISYGVYIYSFPLQQAFLVAGFSGSWPGFVLVSVSATIPIAALSWFLVERPALRLQPRGRRSSPTLRPLPAVAAHTAPAMGLPREARHVVQPD
jgi:peptidoglycan/LPS O-acetylase OafA/YrhL